MQPWLAVTHTAIVIIDIKQKPWLCNDMHSTGSHDVTVITNISIDECTCDNIYNAKTPSM